MTRDDVIRMAREAGYQHEKAVGDCEDFAYFDLQRFAALVAAAEREACAKACDDAAENFGAETAWAEGYEQALIDVADGIRARGKA